MAQSLAAANASIAGPYNVTFFGLHKWYADVKSRVGTFAACPRGQSNIKTFRIHINESLSNLAAAIAQRIRDTTGGTTPEQKFDLGLIATNVDELKNSMNLLASAKIPQAVKTQNAATPRVQGQVQRAPQVQQARV